MTSLGYNIEYRRYGQIDTEKIWGRYVCMYIYIYIQIYIYILHIYIYITYRQIDRQIENWKKVPYFWAKMP